MRRESQQRQKREKILNDVEKSDARSREAKRRNRWSWGGNIHGKPLLTRRATTRLTADADVVYFFTPKPFRIFRVNQGIIFYHQILGIWWYSLKEDSIPEGIECCMSQCEHRFLFL